MSRETPPIGKSLNVGEFLWAEHSLNTDLPSPESASLAEICEVADDHKQFVESNLSNFDHDPLQPFNLFLTTAGRIDPSSLVSPNCITIPSDTLRQHGWVELLRDVRYAMVKVWQLQNGYKEIALSEQSSEHWTFHMWMIPMNIRKHPFGRIEAEYDLNCLNCEWRQTSNKITDVVHRVVFNELDCPNCTADRDKIIARDLRDCRLLLRRDVLELSHQ